MLQLSKADKLCSRTKINQLFHKGQAFVAYPLRIVYHIHDKNYETESHQFFINVPKKRFKRAVKRVWLRRRIREAYRLNKAILPASKNIAADIAFLYIGSEKKEFSVIEHRMKEALERLAEAIKSHDKHDTMQS